nr:H-NS family nucleoid-associated regulatory protein [Pelomonas sp. P7]
MEDFRNPNFRRASQQVEPFCDADGNTWSGRGRRPTWLTEAINGGADLEDFRNPAHAGS